MPSPQDALNALTLLFLLFSLSDTLWQCPLKGAHYLFAYQALLAFGLAMQGFFHNRSFPFTSSACSTQHTNSSNLNYVIALFVHLLQHVNKRWRHWLFHGQHMTVHFVPQAPACSPPGSGSWSLQILFLPGFLLICSVLWTHCAVSFATWSTATHFSFYLETLSMFVCMDGHA